MTRLTISPSERLHALDAVRAYALLLGIVLHAIMSFVPVSGLWPIHDTHPSLALGLLSFAIHVFRMTTFFLIAGFFARMSFHRRGIWGFVRDRLQRIGLPLVIGWPILFTLIGLVLIWASDLPNGVPISRAPAWLPALPNFPLTHLWFLYVLLEIYVAMLLLRSAIVWLDASGALRAFLDRLFAAIMRNPLAPLLLAIPIGIAFSLDPTWTSSVGVRTPDRSLVTNAQAWIGFGTAFGVGWLLHRQVDLLRFFERRWLWNLVAALALILISFVLSGVMISAPGAPKLPVSFATLRLVSIVLYALGIWISTFAFVGLALRFMSGFSRMRRYLADASYWLYLIHLPIVMALQVAVSQLDWPGPIKFATILVVALPLMLASYHLLVRFTIVGVVLNGRRAPRETAPAAAVTGSAVS
ncbi:acyltransferase family protein [Bradyrhizobium manausense]|uniref:acyltransferase family protein n=1 Tax=Bradyrhizobium TaxID=374 RepID=UPI001BA762A2|nr:MULTISPECIES: acyltransferase family protein [Bradyrhizobium]MBR0826530.1 acyltransferase family protein [Bradyrhizobium manausense]UVO28926.1 acyltransferase family protein [Bradyrhizobium arachidis]